MKERREPTSPEKTGMIWHHRHDSPLILFESGVVFIYMYVYYALTISSFGGSRCVKTI